MTHLARVKYLIDRHLDLRAEPQWSPIFVSRDLNSSLVTIDGNHRLMAHHQQHPSINGAHGWLFAHANMSDWGFIPQEAKNQ